VLIVITIMICLHIITGLILSSSEVLNSKGSFVNIFGCFLSSRFGVLNLNSAVNYYVVIINLIHLYILYYYKLCLRRYLSFCVVFRLLYCILSYTLLLLDIIILFCFIFLWRLVSYNIVCESSINKKQKQPI